MWWILGLVAIIVIGIGEQVFRRRRRLREVDRLLAQHRRIAEAIRVRPWERFESETTKRFWLHMWDEDFDAAERVLASREPLL